ncbi:hypothetical protein BDR04DRAFT_1115506 [Suillus decipiens]|nr:hypothetical protein BDR04DRAFT_1115506 [Suillus decipiens]
MPRDVAGCKYLRSFRPYISPHESHTSAGAHEQFLYPSLSLSCCTALFEKFSGFCRNICNGYGTYGKNPDELVLCAALLGVSCMQTFSYFSRLVNSASGASACLTLFSVMSEMIDGSKLRTMNAAHTVLVVHGGEQDISIRSDNLQTSSAAYAYLVIHFGNSSFLEVVLPVSSTGFLISAIVTVCVQGIFVIKAQRLSETRSRVLPTLWIPLAIFELGAVIHCVAKR